MSRDALHSIPPQRNLALMKRLLLAFVLASALSVTAQPSFAGPPPAAASAFDSYAHTVEVRLASQHLSAQNFLTLPATCPRQPTTPCIERVAVTSPPGAMLHHWRATLFVPHTAAADLDRLLRNVTAYPTLFAPQVERASATPLSADHLHVTMRTRQRHVLTVVLDADYDVTFTQLDPRHRSSASRSTQISEIDSPSTSRERALSPDEEHGFLWRQNTYWSYAERDGGLLIQVESLSLTRSIPTGLGWAIDPFVESIPRDSLAFTLRSIRAGLVDSQALASAHTNH